MLRRDFINVLPALTAIAEVPRLRGARIKITDARVLRTRLIRETGPIVNCLHSKNGHYRWLLENSCR